MATTALAAPTAATTGIAGDPAALYAAADEMTATAKAYFNAADAIAAHGRAVTANWYGDASDAAGRHIQTLSTRVQVGSEVYTAAATAIRTYAGELAAAQDAWNQASSRATTAATALGQAHQQASTAAAMPTTDTTGKPDPTAQATRSQATDDAASAITTASTALSSAQQDMATAVANAAAANQRAADAITTCCDQLTAMGGEASTIATASTGGTGTNAAYTGATAYAAPATPPQHHESAWDGAIDWAEDAGGWLGDHASDISAIAGTAAAITAFIPGVDLIATPILAGVAFGFGAGATTEDIQRGDTGAAVEDGIGTALNVVPGVGMLRTLGRMDEVTRLFKAADEIKAVTAAETATETEAAATKKALRWEQYQAQKTAAGKPAKSYEAWSKIYDTNQGQAARGNAWQDERMSALGIVDGEGGWATQVRLQTPSGKIRVQDIANVDQQIAREFKSGTTPSKEALGQLAADEELLRMNWDITWDLKKPLSREVMGKIVDLQDRFPANFRHIVGDAEG